MSARQIRRGSKARYDSRDGYDWHPRKAKYRKLDRNYPDYQSGTTSGSTSSGGTYTGCRAYGPDGTSIDGHGRRCTKIDCVTKQPL